MIKKLLLVFLGFAVSLGCGMYLQETVLAGRGVKLFPAPLELLPHTAIDLFEYYRPPAAPGQPAHEEPFFFTGEQHRYLGNFFGKLASLKEGTRPLVRVMHFGDSLIWGDNITAVMRNRFIADFGDGGRGLVPAIHVPATQLKDYKNLTPPHAFTLRELGHRFRDKGVFRLKPDTDPLLGFTGEGCVPLSFASVMKYETSNGSRPWHSAKVFIKPAPGNTAAPQKYTITLASGAHNDTRTLELAPGMSGCADFSFDPAASLDIGFAGSAALPVVEGVCLETGKGIQYSTFVRMGTHLAWLGAVPETCFSAGMKAASPDLVIFQYGINEAASLESVDTFTKEYYAGQMKDFLLKLKALLPDTDILIIGPMERLTTKNGSLAPMKETFTVIEVQKAVARDLGLAFFDCYEYLGGPGHMATLVAKGLASTDYTHINFRGGDLLGNGIYDTMMNAYGAWSGRDKEEKRQHKLALEREKNKSLHFSVKGYWYFFAALVLLLALGGQRWRARVPVLVLASFYFYATWKLWPVLLLAGVTLGDYLWGRLIYRARLREGRGTVFLVLSIITDLGLLVAFKYYNFFAGLGASLAGAGAPPPLLDVALPIGISFYLFRSLSYTIDIWRGACAPRETIGRYALYVSFFPQILAGPLSRANDFFRDLDVHGAHFTVTGAMVSGALFLICAGLVKKTGADWLAASLVDRVYANPSMFSSLETFTAVLAYGVQIYGDFSGYSDIAIGCALLVGIRVPQNFRRPYLSVSLSEFWRRWHITLGAWFREYLYIPLGGSRRRVYLNLFLTMLLCGMWHGAGVNFMVWGAFHGLLLAGEKLTGFDRAATNAWARIFRTGITLSLVLFGWVIFRVDSWGTFTEIMKSLARLDFRATNISVLLAGVIGAMYLLHFIPEKLKEVMAGVWEKAPSLAQGFACAAVAVALYNISTAAVKPFIYFNF